MPSNKPLSNCVYHREDRGFETRRFCPYCGKKMNVLVNNKSELIGIALDKWWMCTVCRFTFKQGSSDFHSAELSVRITKLRRK